MRNIYAISCLILLLGSCSETSDEGTRTRPGTDKIEVILPIAESFDDAQNYAVGEMPITRTLILGDEGLNKAGWAETDQVAIWAVPEVGGGADFTLTAETFSYYTPIQGNALFTATIHEMTSPTYIYYGAYPVPNTINGTEISYTLSSEQSGSYDGKLDIMLAHPAQGDALTENTTSKAAQLAFAHKCHIMRIQVPTGRNLWGEKIHKLRIEFPTEVVGDLTFDVTDPDAEPLFTNGGRTVTLALERPLDESEEDAADGNYVWVFLRPGVRIDGALKFTAYTSEGYQSHTLSTTISKTLEQGRITPVTITIPQELPVSSLEFSVTGNNLGEDLQKLYFTTPSGATLRSGIDTQTVPVNAANKYVLEYYEQIDDCANGDLIRNTAFTIRYESENALVPQTRVLGDNPQISLTIPYLLSEDFSGLAQDFSDNENTTGVNDPAAIWFDSYGVPHWSAARVGGKAGKCVRVSTRLEGGIGIAAYYEGRMDSPALTGIKSGKTVKVNVSFNYSADNSDKTPTCQYGWSVSSGAINGAPGVENQLGTMSLGKSLNGNYDNVSQFFSFDIGNATDAARISWRVTTSDGVGWGGGWFCRIYFDNVKVQIVK